MKLISPQEMNRLDSSSSIPPEVLMERAGQGMAEFIYEFFPETPVIFFCGSGNNGGDGLVAARYLKKWGRRADVCLLWEKKLKGLPAIQEKRYPGKIKTFSDVNEIKFILEGRKLAVDCILGTGFSPPLRENLKNILEIINKNSKIILSCDIPTGVHSGTGEADPASIKSDITLTFEYPKIGQALRPGSAYSGSIEVIDIGTGLEAEKYHRPFELQCRQDCAGYFKRRKKFTHKKDYGHVLVIGGNKGMEGAAAMASAGALNAGAGLVTCAFISGRATGINSFSMSPMSLLLPELSNGGSSAADEIFDFIENRNIDAVVAGPGMGCGREEAALIKKLIEKLNCPLLLDADGLNCVSDNPDILRDRKGRITVLTPHPGEMKRLLGKGKDRVSEEPVATAREFASGHGVTLLLKGYRSVVSNGEKTYLNSTGNPGMSVGGAGDILSGIIGALLAQGLSGIKAAATGAWVHGRSGDIAVWKRGERSVLPEDFLAEIGKV